MQRELVSAVKQGVIQQSEPALDEAAPEESDTAQPPVCVVFAESDQCTEVAESERRHGFVFMQPGGQMTDQVERLLVGNLRG